MWVENYLKCRIWVFSIYLVFFGDTASGFQKLAKIDRQISQPRICVFCVSCVLWVHCAFALVAFFALVAYFALGAYFALVACIALLACFALSVYFALVAYLALVACFASIDVYHIINIMLQNIYSIWNRMKTLLLDELKTWWLWFFK